MNTLPDRFLLGIAVIGLIIAGTSLFRGVLGPGQVQVEYLQGGIPGNDSTAGGIYVDIEGAVMSPGVYFLQTNSRIKDLLVTAGGYSKTADRAYSEKNLNLAQVLKDGQKIYIPDVSNTPAVRGYAEANSGVKLVNVNAASISELDTLWGIGPARAESIVKNRPYASLDELVSKGAITKQILDKNSESMILY